VALGAFGAHALKAHLGAESLALWQSAAQYHFGHALALLAVGLAGYHIGAAWLKAAGWLFVLGIGLFCGSLYGLALGAPRALGTLAPFGGSALILGWLAFAVAALRG